MTPTLHLVFCASLFPLILAFNKTVSLSSQRDCGKWAYYFDSGSDVYRVVWDGESYPTYCKLRFKMSGLDTYKLCAEVTTYKMECASSGDEERRLNFYWGLDTEHKYDCHSSLPIKHCNEDILFINLEPRYYDIKDSNSKIRITVTATYVSEYKSEDDTGGSILGIVIIAVIVGVIFCIVTCAVILLRKKIARQNTAGATAMRQGTNVNVATAHPYQTHRFTQPNTYQQQQYHGAGAENVPLVQNQAGGGSVYLSQNSPMSESHRSQHGYYANMQPESVSSNQNLTGGQPTAQLQHSPQNQLPCDFTSTASAPPPSYSDVMAKGPDFYA